MSAVVNPYFMRRGLLFDIFGELTKDVPDSEKLSELEELQIEVELVELWLNHRKGEFGVVCKPVKCLEVKHRDTTEEVVAR